MGMMLLKVKYHIVATIRIAFLRALFGSKLRVGGVQPSEDFLTYIWRKEQRLSLGKIASLTTVVP